MQKYRSKSISIDGYNFPSIQEGRYYSDNKDKIKTLQPKFILQEKYMKDGLSIRPILYIADFELHDGTIIDVKGMPTPEAKIKKKLFNYKYPHLNLKRVVKYQGEWVEYNDNEKRKKENKKSKQNL